MRSTSAHAAKFLATVILAGWLVGPHASAPGGDAPPAARAFPLRFEARDTGGFVADTLDGSIAVSETALALADRNGVETLRLTLRGETGAAFGVGEPSLGRTRIVSDGGTVRELASYRSLRARSVVPGVDAVVSGEGGRIELRFEIAASAAPSTISLTSSAAAQLDAAGRVRASSWILGAPLVVRASDPAAAAPAALLTTAGTGELALALPGGDEQGTIEVRIPFWQGVSGFRAPEPVRSAPKLALDADGNAYVASRAPSRSRNGDDPGDILVGRLDRTGTDYVWATYLASGGDDDPRAIAVDAQGRVVVAARDAAGAYVAHLDPSSGALAARTSLDGDDPRAIGADGNGAVWIAGGTTIVRLDADGSLSRFVPPGAPIEAIAVAADGSSIAAARGASVELLSSDGKVLRSADLRALGVERVASLAFARDGRLVAAGGGGDVVIAAIEPGEVQGRVLSVLAGPGTDEAEALAIDRHGRLLVAGRAGGDLGLDVTPRRAPLGGAEGFTAAYDADGRSVVYGAYLGGSADDTASSIAVDGNGRVWVAGSTASLDTRDDEATFPLGAGSVGFVVVLDDAAPAQPGGVCPGDKQFDGGGDGTSWEDLDNWSGNSLPTSGQNVCITGAFNVDVGGGSQNAGTLLVEGGASLTMSSGTLTIAGTSEINGPFTMSGGTLTGAGNITTGSTFTYELGTISGTGLLTAAAGMSIESASFKTVSRSITIPAGQTVTYSGTGGLGINTPATVTNAGTWNHQTDADISGTGTIVNSGTFNRTNSAGLVTIGTDFNNTGTVDVQTGQLALSGDGTDTGDYDSTGAELRFSGGARSMSGTTAITGGDVDVTNGTYTFNGTYDVAGTTSMSFGTFTFTASSTVTNIGSALSISGGTFTFNSGDTIAPGSIDQSGGALTGSDAINVSGLYTFDGGSMAGTGTTTASGGMSIGSASFRTISRNVTIPAGQTVTYSGTGGVGINTPATVTNAGTWNHQTDADISGTGVLSNSGTFNRTNSAGLVSITSDFNNTGTVDVQSGILAISGDGTDTGDYDSAGATLRFSGGVRSMSGTTEITGGNVDVTNGTFTFNGTYDVAGTTSLSFGTFTWTAASTITNVGAVLDCSGGTMTFNSGNVVAPGTVSQSGGTITGSDTINVPGLYTFDGGAISGTGTMNANGGMSFGGAAFRTISRNVVIPAGQTVTYSATGGTGINTPATLTNAGTWNHQTDADLTGAGTITNSGTFNRVNSAGLVTVGANFNNTGTVDVQSGILSFSGNGTDTGDYDATGAMLRFAGGTRSFSAATAMTGGDVDVTAGTLTFNGTYDVTGATSMGFGTFTFTPTSVITSIGSSLTVTGGTLTLNSGDTPTPGTLTLEGGILNGSDNINVTGLFQFDGGTHGGTGTTTANGGVNFGGATFRTLARVLIVPVGDTATYAGTGGMAINVPGTLTNNGTFEHQTDADISGTGPFNNTGTFNRTTSAGSVTYSCPFNNTGSVDVQSGELRLGGGGLDTGDYDCTGAILDFSGGTRTIGAAATITGGEVQFSGATMTIDATYDVAGRTFQTFGGVTFTPQSTITNIGSALDVDAGTLTFNSGDTVAPNTLTFTGGTITGSDALSISGLFTWEAGTLSGTGAATANGGIALTTASGKTLARSLTNFTGSTATYSGSGGLGITAPAVLTNAVGATWDHQTDAQVTGTGSINNLGTFNRTTSAGELLIFSDFDNGGTVDVQSGSLHLNGGGNASGSYDATGTLLRLGSGTYTFTNTSSITGTDFEFRFCTATLNGSYNVTGTTLFSGGDATFAPPSTITSVGATLDLDSGNAVFNSGDTITVGTLLMTGGNLRGSDHVNVTGPVDWESGQMSGTGTTTLQGGLTIDTFGVTLARPLVNATGSTAVTSGANAAIFFSQGGSVTNQAGATWEVQNDGGYSDPGNVAFDNAGTFRRTTSTNAMTIDLPFTNTGTVEILSGSITAQNYTQTAGVTRLDGGGLASGTNPIRIFGGSLAGSGSITGNVTIGQAAPPGGAFAPGVSAAGAIDVTGTTTFAAGGSYACEIGGLTAGAQHDFIGGPTSGPLVVGGTLDVSLINGFDPAVGNSFTIMQGSSRTGTFATTNLPPLSGGNVWTVTYTPTTVVLNVGPPITADLSVTNVDAPDPVNAGGNVTYSVTVASAGPDPATGVTLVHTLDGTTSFVSATPSQGTCGNAAGTVTCDLGNLASGANATISIVATTSSGSVPSITASASVSGNEADLNNANNTASATTTVTPVADLSIVKSDTPDPVAAAGTITYTLDVSNAGPNDATGLTVTDNLPAGVSFVSATGTGWACGDAGQTVTCTRPALALGAAPSITINVTAPASPGSITNNASVTATSFDPTTPNTASAGTSVTAVADLSITKGDAPDPVDAGATLTYTLDVSNAGPSPASTISVTDTLPAGVGFVSATGTGWTCGHVAGVVTCTRPTLAVAAAPSITITVTAPVTGGTITNTATATAAEFDPNTPNTVSVDTDVTAIADISVSKTDSPDPVFTSSTLTYTVTVTNNGPSPATSVVAIDALPAGVAFVSADGTGWSCNEASLIVTCTRPTLAVGAAPPITIVVTSPATPGLISNGVSAGAAEEDRDPDDNVDAEQTSVALVTADLSIAKADSADPVNAGAAFSYTLAIANGGPDPATNVTVTDTLPAGVAYVSAAGTGWSCGHVTGVVTCTRPALAVGAAPPITIDVTAPAEGGAISNTATVSGAEADNDSADNSDTEGTTVTAVANVTIAKTDSPDPVAASGNLTYTISVANAGPSTATGLTMTDNLPAGVGFVSANGTGWTCGQLAGVVTCTRAALSVGAAPDITIVVTAPAAPGQITNTASVTATENDPSTPNTATATTTVTAVADLSISKTDSPDPVNAGQDVTYTIDVANAGPSTANTISVTDTLPAGAAYVSATGTGWSCGHAAGIVTCTRPTLAVGAAPAISIVITPPVDGGTISNTATATAAEFDPTTPNTATADTTVVPIADLSIVKTDTPDPVNIGTALTYNLAVTNLGPSPAASVTVTDTLPATVAFVSATGTGWTCGHAAGVVTCTSATLPTGAAPVIAITVTAPGTIGPISNTATVATTTTDPVAGNNSDTEGTTVNQITADLSIVKSDSADPVDAGAALSYTLGVSNGGPDPASTVTVTDTLPAGVAFVSAAGSGWSCGHAAGVVTCTRPALAVGAAPAITVSVTAPAEGGLITNTAGVSAPEFDGDPADNTDGEGTNVTAVANLTIAKTDAPDPVAASGDITYTISVANAGPSTATALTMTDTLPAGVALVSATGTGWACGNVGQTVTCTRPTLAVGAAPDVTIVVTAPAAPGQITNTASVTATENDPSTPNTATATTNVTAVADLTISKTDAPDPVNAGQNLTYTIDVSNAGPSTANAVSVTDTLPPGSAFVSATGTGWSCGQAAGTVTCTRATLAAGAAPSISIVITPPAAGGTISNTATVSANEFDPTTPNTATADTTVVPIADLSIAKSDTPDPVNTGSPFAYTLAVANLGPSPAANVVVADTIPAGVAIVAASGTGWSCGIVGQTVTCTQATLPVGAAAVITIDVTAPGTTGPLSNSATVGSTTNDPVAGNNADTEGTTVTTITADLSIVKSDSADPVGAGAAFSYTLAVSNAGPDQAGTVTVTDTLPAGVAFVSATGTGWSCGNVGQTVTCTRPALALGAAPPITIDVTASAEGGALSNTSTVGAPEFDPNGANNSDTEGTTVTAVANLTIAKTDTPDPVAASGTITYTITVDNAGPSTATDLTVTDTLPAGVAVNVVNASGWACTALAGTVTCTRATLAVGPAPDIVIGVTAPATPGQITNTASVTATTSDPSTPNTATATTNVTAVADLTITKSDNPDPVNAGQNLTYTIDVANAGPSTANAVSVTDTLPPGSAFVSATGTGWSCGLAAGTVTCTRATLAVGAAPSISIVITPPSAGGTISNTATVVADEFDPTTPNTATATTTVVPIADLSIAKTDTPDPVNIGSAFAYHLNVTNLGPSPAANVTVSDTIPSGVTITGAAGSGWSCTIVGQTVTCTRATLSVGVAFVITIDVTAPGTTGPISNTATVATTTTDPVPGNNSDTEGTTITTVTADLSITKLDNPDPVNTGAALTYTINVSNAGPDPANGVSVVDTLPPGVTNVVPSGAGWTCNTIAGVVTCTRATLAVGAAPPITIAVDAPIVGGVLTNTATVSASEADGNLADNTATTTTTVNVVTDLSIAKTDSPDPVPAGGVLTYTVTVTNLSVATATGVTVTDNLPATIGFVVPPTGTGWTCTNINLLITCTRATLAPGAAPPITITVNAPDDGGPITNTATVASTSSDPVAANNTASTTTTVTAVADLSITKSDSADPVDAGTTFSYTLDVTNAGPSTAATLSVSDPLPAGATLVSATGTGWTCTGTTTVTCTRATLAVGPAPTITINVRAPNNGGTLTNTATVTSATQDPDAADRTDTETTTVTPVADMSITKTSTQSTVGVGAPLAWTLTVRNLGPSPATNVQVTDFLPAGVQFVSATGSGWTCAGPVPVQCTRATLAVGVTSTITLNATAPVLPGSVTNTATVEAAEGDPFVANDTGQSTVEAVIGPACGSLEDLLAAIGDAGLDPRLRATLESPVVAAIAAVTAGQPGVAATKLGLFQKHCAAGATSGRIDPEDAQELLECAASLRDGLMGGGTSGATAPVKRGGAKPANPVRRR